ncbi:NADH dehydrogenase [ubiquinone] 1 beta subcomplex subunit 3 [Onthophagus taurus]|uniref:NADH dehydrogenase [ubiquinone] 1 beta subcomplex subunit 3 n=1 Tax=Onthophagus taurus TaxID=166361 RepID=UPI000C20C1FE|nr:NADH dehydrogenase [ubiquinone] 1 beta subcomplex subunit 3 [Onthophagus taurus]XP_022909741.1 NADH dehydrogenase [ubiquinone] 1 beta subcomplex subunit 3 [Onthophagus taurus]
MGGHGHGEPYTVPDYRIYKVENVPELLKTQRALAAQGLKDPWLRNEVWRYDVKAFGTEKMKLSKTFFTGFKWGVLAVIVTLAGTAAYDKAFPPKHGHGHGGH